MSRLEKNYLLSQLRAIDDLLGHAPPEDILGKMGLEGRRRTVAEALQQLAEQHATTAQVALYFGGRPVVGSTGILTAFATNALGSFQDLVTKVWSKETTGGLSNMGPVKEKQEAQLHITSLVHGSFGFLLEELDHAPSLFESSLRKAADEAMVYLTGFADPDENHFTQVIEAIHPRVFASVKRFFGTVYKEDATFRLVEGGLDQSFDASAVERAWFRAEHSNVDEDEPHYTGRLLGVIPIKRRFEFQRDDEARIIEGKVGDEFSQSYLDRMSSEQFAGKRWKAVFKRRIIEKPGRPLPIEQYTLLKLDEIEEG